MARVRYPGRILADKEFIQWLIENNKLAFLRLTHIKASSIDHRGEHNIILKNQADEILELGLIKSHTLKGAFKRKTLPEEIVEVHNNEIDQQVVYAIMLASKNPYFKAYILTTKEKAQEYEASSHYQNLKTIEVKAEEDALELIESFWRKFTYARGLKR